MKKTTRRHLFQKNDNWALCALCGHPKNNTVKHFIAPEGWQPIELAPLGQNVIVIMATGEAFTAHYARDLSGEDQPPFQGWFRAVKKDNGDFSHYALIGTPEGWKPVQSAGGLERETR